MDVFDALSHPVRREILALLRDGDRPAGELAAQFDLTKPTVSAHFATLKKVGLVGTERRGTQIFYSLNLSLLEEALLGLMERVGGSRGKWASALQG